MLKNVKLIVNNMTNYTKFIIILLSYNYIINLQLLSVPLKTYYNLLVCDISNRIDRIKVQQPENGLRELCAIMGALLCLLRCFMISIIINYYRNLHIPFVS